MLVIKNVFWRTVESCWPISIFSNPASTPTAPPPLPDLVFAHTERICECEIKDTFPSICSRPWPRDPPFSSHLRDNRHKKKTAELEINAMAATTNAPVKSSQTRSSSGPPTDSETNKRTLIHSNNGWCLRASRNGMGVTSSITYVENCS